MMLHSLPCKAYALILIRTLVPMYKCFSFSFSFPRYAEFRVQGPSALVENAQCQTVSAALMWQSHTLPTECPYNRVSLLNNVSMARHLVAVQEEALILPCLQMKYTLIINMTDVVLLDRQSIEV